MTLEGFKDAYKDKTPQEKLVLLVRQFDIKQSDAVAQCRATMNGNFRDEQYYASEVRHMEDRINWLYHGLWELLGNYAARVMALDEIDVRTFGKPYILETNMPGDEPRMMWGLFSIYTIARNYVFIGIDGRINVNDKDYGRTWRAWTAKPTEKQREALSWAN